MDSVYISSHTDDNAHTLSHTDNTYMSHLTQILHICISSHGFCVSSLTDDNAHTSHTDNTHAYHLTQTSSHTCTGHTRHLTCMRMAPHVTDCAHVCGLTQAPRPWRWRSGMPAVSRVFRLCLLSACKPALGPPPAPGGRGAPRGCARPAEGRVCPAAPAGRGASRQGSGLGRRRGGSRSPSGQAPQAAPPGWAASAAGALRLAPAPAAPCLRAPREK